AVAATTRIGQVFEAFAEEMRNAPLVGFPRTPEGITAEEFRATFRDAYCDALIEQSDFIVRRAVEAYEACNTKAAELGVTGQWQELCARKRASLDPPRKRPESLEIRRNPH